MKFSGKPSLTNSERTARVSEIQKEHDTHEEEGRGVQQQEWVVGVRERWVGWWEGLEGKGEAVGERRALKVRAAEAGLDRLRERVMHYARP